MITWNSNFLISIIITIIFIIIVAGNSDGQKMEETSWKINILYD